MSANSKPIPCDSGVLKPGKKLWVMRLLAAVGLPCLMLMGIEGLLRLTGYGYPTSFYLKKSAPDSVPSFQENPRFGWRFFPPPLARTPQPVNIPAQKATNTCRIFVLGESAVMGDPEPAYGFVQILRTLLEARFPDKKFELVNTAMTAINSHVILPIARESASLQGDIWIIYLGNNEVVGPFGAGTVFGRPSPPISWIRARIWLQSFKLAQWLQTVVRAAKIAGVPQQWEGMAMFLDRQIGLHDPRLRTVQRQFERNLEDIINTGLRAKIEIVLCSVAVNLRDCPPFASQHREALSSADSEKWNALYKDGVQFMEQQNFPAAWRAFQAAEKLDPTYAELRYFMGRCCEALNEIPASKEHYEAACELDTLRFRTDRSLNAIIGKIAEKYRGDHLTFVDVPGALAAVSTNGIPGAEFFYEHVHFNFAGNYRLATQVAQAILPRLEKARQGVQPTPWITPEECRRRLAFTSWNQVQILENLQSRFQKPPFTLQAGHSARLAQLSNSIAGLKSAFDTNAFQQWRDTYETAIQRSPGDWHLRYQYGRLLEAYRQPTEAAEQWRELLRLAPNYIMGYFSLGKILNRGEDRSEALRYLDRALEIMPYFPEAFNSRGIALAHQRKFDESYRSFASALELRPDYAEAQVNWGMTLQASGRLDEARAHYESALQINSNYPAAHYQIAGLLQREGKVESSQQHYALAFALQPESPPAHLRAGNLCFSRSNYVEAVCRYREALRLDPAFAEAYHRLGLVFAVNNQMPEAEQFFRRAIQLEPEFTTARYDYGVCLFRQSRYAEAIEQFETVLRTEPDNTHARKFLEDAQKATPPANQ